MKKRVLSLFMALALCLTLLPTAALAEENTTEPSTQLTETTSVPEEPEEPETPDQPEETKTPDQGEDTKTPDPSEEPPQDEEPPAAEEVAPVGAMLSAAATTGEEHTHYLCGGDTCNKVGHADEGTATTFQPWDGSNTNGAFYLTKDWTLTSTITVPTDSSLTLCLNGYSITLGSQAHNVDPGSYDVFLVQRHATFTLCDCKDKNGNYGTIGHYNPTENQGPGVNVAGTFNMYGGKIFQNQVKFYDGNPRGYGGGVLVSGAGTFNMFGGEITGNTAKSGGVYVDGMFSMSGGTIYDNAGERGGGVYVTPNGMFNMSGSAAITGNTGTYGGVYVEGTFSMSGGTICGNTESSGGGVYVDYSGTFNMSGSAAITGNTVTGNGGGVYVRDTAKKMNVSGDVKIENNWKGGTLNADTGLYEKGNGSANNLCLDTDKYVIITGDGGLGKDARIGVTTAEAPTSNENISIATGATAELSYYTSIFTPDVQNQGYVIAKNGEMLSVHQHSWGYTESGATITATCQASDCPNKNGGSVTIAAPAELTYNGSVKPATVTASSDWQGPAVNEDAISYIKTDPYIQQLENGALPTNADTYTASITLGDATASVKYTIAKAELTVTPNSGQRKSYGTIPDPVLAYTSTGTVTGETAAFDGALSREAGEDVGQYDITKGSLALKDSGTFKATNYNLVLDTAVVTFEITKGTYGGSAPTKTVNILKNYAGVQTGTLTAADFFTTAPAEAKITNAVPNAASSNMMSIAGADSSGNFTYDSKTNITAASDESWTVTISSKNYTDITGTLTFKLVDKTDVSAQITFPNGTLTYNGAGQKYEKATISGVSGGTWNYTYVANSGTGASLDSAGLPKTAGTYTVTAKYEDDAHIGTKNATLTVSKATPTGAPTCTKITTSGKTLADAPLAIGTIAPAGGTLAWDMAANTVVAANTAYGWTYTPADTANYKALTGSLTPYAVSSGGGGGGSAATSSVSDRIARELKNAKEGSTVTIDMKGETKLPASTTKEIAGKDVTVELDMGGGMVWSFNGLDVPKGGVRLDLGVKTGTKTIPAKVINALTGETTTIQLQLNHNGSFGMSLNLSVDLGKKHDGLYANLYFYNPKSSALEFRSAGMISGGKASWAFDHASDYAIVIDKESHEPMTFTDVPDTAYYAEAVNWAVAKKITEGVGNKLFGPNDPCTRAQIVTFLWRAAGSPGPKTMSGFSDVPADSYYAKAVAWAVENGITGGTGDGKFSPDATCTRAQAVTFLYRASGAPAASGNAAFSDVAANAYYAAAVKWAEKNGITGGIGGGLFGSGNDCTRAQIVTFLYRNYQSK